MSTTLKPLFRPGLAAQLRETAANLGKGRGVQDLRLDLIDPDPDQPRIGLTDADCEGLAESIRVAGRVFQPIIVRKRGDRYLLADGERRWRAARLAGLTALPAIIAETEDRIEELQLVANQHHKRLTNREAVRAVERLTAAGRDRKHIATLLDIPDWTVKHYRAVAEMAEPIAAWIDRADIRAVYELHLAHKSADEKGRGVILDRLAALEGEGGELTILEARRLKDAISGTSRAADPFNRTPSSSVVQVVPRDHDDEPAVQVAPAESRAGEGTPSPITNESSSTRKGISVTRKESQRLNTPSAPPTSWVKDARRIADMVPADQFPEVHAILAKWTGGSGRGAVRNRRRTIRGA